MHRFLIIVLLAGFHAAAPTAELRAFACEPEWTALLAELAGDRVTVDTATTAAQDPHYIQARPSLIARIRAADLLVCSGAQLEVGWLPLLLRRSGNRNLMPDQPGHFMAAEQVRRIEIPERLDRGQGDIHPDGNPHVHLNPHNVRRIAAALSERLGAIDPAGRAEYARRLAAFEQRWDSAIARWETRAAPLAGIRLITHHRSFSYLADWLGLEVVGNVEPKPGIPASGAHLALLLAEFGPNPPRAIVRTPFADPKPSAWLSERLGVPALALPYTVGGDDTADLFELFDRTIDALLATAR